MNRIIIFFLLLVSYHLLNDKFKIEELFANLKFCNTYKLSNAYRESFLKHDINLHHGDNWDLYYPCGYSNVESELKNMKIENKKIFAIEGCDNIVSKNNLWKILILKFGRKKASEIMPESFLKSEFDIFLKQYDPKDIYILKKNLQRKQGLLLTKDINKIKYYINNDFKIIQKYIHNPLLINNRKINLRLYLLIICHKNKVNFHFHKKGKCIYTNLDYKNNDLNPERNITSLNITNYIYNNRPESLDELEKFLGKNKYDLIMNDIIGITKLCCLAIKNNICKSDNIKNSIRFQLFGLDYVIDNNLKSYLLEINKGPNMSYKSGKDKELKSKIMSDIIYLLKIDEKPSNYKNKFIKLL